MSPWIYFTCGAVAGGIFGFIGGLVAACFMERQANRDIDDMLGKGPK